MRSVEYGLIWYQRHHPYPEPCLVINISLADTCTDKHEPCGLPVQLSSKSLPRVECAVRCPSFPTNTTLSRFRASNYSKWMSPVQTDVNVSVRYWTFCWSYLALFRLAIFTKEMTNHISLTTYQRLAKLEPR